MLRMKLRLKTKSIYKGIILKAPYKGLLVRENLFILLIFAIISQINNDY